VYQSTPAIRLAVDEVGHAADALSGLDAHIWRLSEL
jgi:hypothetical protein